MDLRLGNISIKIMPKKGYKQSKEHKLNIILARKGYKHSKETRKKMSLSHKGKECFFKGKNLSEEHKKKISLAHKGLKQSPEVIEKRRKSRIGYRHSLETKQKISKSNFGKKLSDETKQKIGKAATGRIVSKETRLKLSECHRGEKSSNWKGGKSFEEYSTDWTETLRRSIRERDHYVCQICGKIQGDFAHDVHHIDYDKKNCNPDNLITLCHSCHSKTSRNRENWILFFKTRVFINANY